MAYRNTPLTQEQFDQVVDFLSTNDDLDEARSFVWLINESLTVAVVDDILNEAYCDLA